MLVLGIDPGVRGGMALVMDGRHFRTWAFRPDMSEHAFVTAALQATDYRLGALYMEKVGYIRGDGGQGAFTFGKVYGLLRGAVRSSYAGDMHDVPPQVWQAAMECMTGGDKNVSKRRAQALFPGVKVTHAIADALLIARYGWLREQRAASFEPELLPPSAP